MDMSTTQLTERTAALTATCAFPACEGAAVTTTVMCDHHQKVSVSQTGSWLEAG
jgi:hypothetical protein